MKHAKKKYRLFALPMGENTFAAVEKERFSRVSARYALVYKAGKAPENGVEVPAAESDRLTKEDLAWLADCNFVLIAESMRENEKQIAADMRENLERLETALKAEKENLKEG